MPSEFENLVVRVTLDDQASAGLERIHEQIKHISHERHKDFFEKISREFKSFRPIAGEAAGEFAKVTEHLAVFTRFGGAVGGIATVIAMAAIETARRTKEFADNLNEVFRTATYSGFGMQQLKNLYEVLRRVNDIPPEQFEAIANSIGSGLEELQREGSPLRRWFESETPAMGKVAEDFLGALADEAKRRDFGAMQRRYMNIPAFLEKLAREQNLPPEVATGWRRRAAARLQLPQSVAAREWGEIKTATEKEEEDLKKLLEMSEEWERQMGRVKSALHDIRMYYDDWQAQSLFAEGGFVVTSFEWVATTLEGLYEKLKEIRELGLSGFLAKHGWSSSYELPPLGREAPALGTRPVQLMSTEADQHVDDLTELVREFRRFNALISGEEKPGGAAAASDLAGQLGAASIGKNPAFHNSPQGGAVGESNPMTLPPGSPQPGGGSAAEAVGPVHGKGWDIETQRKVRKAWPGTTESITGKGSWYGTYGKFHDESQDKPGSASLGQMWGMKYFPEERQGIALRSAATLGRLFRVTWPDGTQTIEQHTDIGPAKWTGKDVDVSAAAATRAGQTPESFKTGGQFTAEILPSFGQEARMQRAAAAASVGRPSELGVMSTPEITPTSALRPSVRSYQAAQRALQQTAQRAPALYPDEAAAAHGEVSSAYPYLTDRLRIRSEQWERMLRESPRSRNIEDRRLNDPTVDLPPMRDFDRSAVDRELGEGAREPSGNLNVTVKAPAGTEVKADGDGMFKGNVSLDRQMQLPTLQ